MSLGEDIFAVLISVALIMILIFAIQNSFSIKENEEEAKEKRRLLLTISDYVKNGEFTENKREKKPFNLDKNTLEKEFSHFVETMKRGGVDIQLEILSLDHELLFKSKESEENYKRSLSLPIVYEREKELTPAKMIIRIRK